MKMTRKRADKLIAPLKVVLDTFIASRAVINNGPIDAAAAEAWDFLDEQIRSVEAQIWGIEYAYVHGDSDPNDWTRRLVSENID